MESWQNPRKGPRRRFPPPSGWLDVDVVAEQLKVSVPTVLRRARRDVLEARFAAGRTVVSEKSVQAYVAAMAEGRIPRDWRLLRGSDRKPSSWIGKFPDAYVEAKQASR